MLRFGLNRLKMVDWVGCGAVVCCDSLACSNRNGIVTLLWYSAALLSIFFGLSANVKELLLLFEAPPPPLLREFFDVDGES